MGNNPTGPAVPSSQEVDISSKGLRELPPLPPATTQLLVYENFLSSIEALASLQQSLQYLDAGQNAIYHVSGELLAHLPRLQVLKLYRNKLSTLPSELGSLSELRCAILHLFTILEQNFKELDVSHNSLGYIPKETARLLKLRDANFSRNQIAELPKDLSNLTSLTRLLLNNNRLETLVDPFGPFSQLTHLNLSENALKSLPPSFGLLKALNKLYLNNNELEALPTEMGQLASLRELNLRNNALKEVPASFAGLSSLQVLDLTNNDWQWPEYDKYSNNPTALLGWLKEAPEHRPAKAVPARLQNSRQNLPKYGSLKKVVVPPTVLVSTPAPEWNIELQRKRLFRFKGSSRILISKMNAAVASLNSGDSFLLDTGSVLYVWHGARANSKERIKAEEFARRMQAEECVNSALFICEDGSEKEELWKELGGRGLPLAAEEAGADEQAEEKYHDIVKAFKIVEQEGGRVDILALETRTQLARTAGANANAAPLSRTLLDSSHVIVLDCFSEIFVWAGTLSTQTEKSWAMLKAEELSSRNRPACCDVTWVPEGGELLFFREQFIDWKAMNMTSRSSVSGEEEQKRLRAQAEEELRQLKVESRTAKSMSSEEEQKRKEREARWAAEAAAGSNDTPTAKPTEPTPAPTDKKLFMDKYREDVARKKQLSIAEAPEAARPANPKLAAVQGSGHKRAASVNPIRARQTMQQKAEAIPQSEKDNNKTKTAARNMQAGGLGLLYSLGVDSALFQQRKEARREAAVAAGRGSTAGDPDWENVGKKTYAGKVCLQHSPQYTTRLFWLKGRKTVFVRQVELSRLSLNSGDVFILDTPKIIYQWNGAEANRMEKGKALDFAKKLKDKAHAGDARIVVLEERENIPADFWTPLGGPGPIPAANTAPEDREAEQAMRSVGILYLVEMNGTNAELREVARAPIMKETLTSDKCFILDCVSEIYPWTGQKAKAAYRAATIAKAQQIAQARSHDCWIASPDWEFEGSESVWFREKFANWGGGLPISVQQVAVGKNTAAARKQEKIDVMKLHNAKNTATEVMIDDGSGTIFVWRIEDFKKVEVPQSTYGQFWSAESYIVLYKYIWKNKDQFIIYFWQGRNSTINDKGTSALLTIELDDKTGRNAKEIRVVQFKEPRHFMAIFKNRLVIHNGKMELAAKPSLALYQVRAEGQGVRAVQTTLRAKLLNSNDVFVLLTQAKSFVWVGCAAGSLEKQFALENSVLQQAAPTIVTVEEGKETPEFWDALGKAAYVSSSARRETRLFQCSVGSGLFEVSEVYKFCQDDLQSDDVMMLDAGDIVYVWEGRYRDDKEIKMALETALEYATKSPNGRLATSPVLVVKEDQEPARFYARFLAWDFNMPHTLQRRPGLSEPETLPEASVLLAEYSRKYTYEELVNGKYPKGIDVGRLERYLSDEEFEEVFGMTPADFAILSSWKREALKKEKRLF